MVKLSNLHWFYLTISLIVIIPFPTIAKKIDLSQMILATGSDLTSVIVTGYTGGSYSLSSISNTDKNGLPCVGYSDPKPDHSMILENDFDLLSIQVDSGGRDTTLVIQGPNDSDIRCSFGQKQVRDALIEDSNWQAGHYNIWVGSMQPNQKANYRLSVK
jgi:hypothetical protein